MSQTAYINANQGFEVSWNPGEGISISALDKEFTVNNAIDWNLATTSSKVENNVVEGDNKMKKWEKIIERYSSKMMKNYIEKREARIREVMLKDNTMNAIVQILHQKEDADGLERDSLFNDFYEFFFDNSKLLSKETVKECDKIFEDWRDQCQALTTRLSEVKAVLEMTDTYEQMKEVLLQYGILNWGCESDK